MACLAIDKSGRQILLLTMSIAMSCTLFGLGTYFEIYIPSPGANSSSDVTPLGLLGLISHSVSASKINFAFCRLYSFVQLVFSFGLGSSTLAYHVRDISHTSSRTVRALVWQPLRTGFLLLPRRIISCRRQWPFRERIGSLEDAPFLVLSLFIWLCRKLKEKP